MEKTRKIGIYGGPFSPPHNGHVYVAEAFYRAFSLDALYIIPSFIPPHKQVGQKDDPSLRLEMTKIAFSHHPDYGKKIFVSDMELLRGGKSYTADTLAYFRAHEEGELYFLCGTDMILSMDTWYNPGYLFESATMVYARRENEQDTEDKIRSKVEEYRSKYNGRVLPLNVEALPLSSTEVRERCRAGQSIRHLVPDGVWQFILDHGLYQGG